MRIIPNRFYNNNSRTLPIITHSSKYRLQRYIFNFIDILTQNLSCISLLCIHLVIKYDNITADKATTERRNRLGNKNVSCQRRINNLSII